MNSQQSRAYGQHTAVEVTREQEEHSGNNDLPQQTLYVKAGIPEEREVGDERKCVEDVRLRGTRVSKDPVKCPLSNYYYLRVQETEKDRGSERASVGWFTTQMSTMARPKDERWKHNPGLQGWRDTTWASPLFPGPALVGGEHRTQVVGCGMQAQAS